MRTLLALHPSPLKANSWGQIADRSFDARKTMTSLYRSVLNDLATLFDQIDEAAVDRAVTEIAAANKIALYGVGREGLQIKGLAMRLFHLGLRAAVVGDMTTPHLGAGDLLILWRDLVGFLPWKR
jgi:D-arabinose 5-phosphate isomerase GutQ